jgi:hypothetical protein
VAQWLGNRLRGLPQTLLERRVSTDRRDPGQHYTTDQQLNPAVASEADGDFLVTWFSLTQDGASGGIFARRFSSAGAALASEFQVNTYTTNYQRNPSVSVAANGSFVVAWQSDLQDGASWGVFARSFSSAGAPLTGELQVNAYTVDYQISPSVALLASGEFVVVWQSRLQDAYSQSVFARRFSSSGAALANEFQISAYTTGGESNPWVAADADGDFIVAWHDGAAAAKNVFARRFSSAGVSLTGNFLVNTYTPDYQYFPSVAASASGDFVVAWESRGGQDGDNMGVFAQRFAAIAALDVDGNGTLDPLTDGLLVLRAFFGFTGTPLTTGAVAACAPAATRPRSRSTFRPSACCSTSTATARPVRSRTVCSLCASSSASAVRLLPPVRSAAAARVAMRRRSRPIWSV